MTVTVTKLATMTKPTRSSFKSPLVHLVQDLIGELIITALIVSALVLFLGEPLESILTSPIFIVLVSAGIIHAAYKYVQRKKATRVE